MHKERIITVEYFEHLLNWLGPTPEQAGRKYETIRQRLITIFTCRGCPEAEDLADETINRVTLKAHELTGSYVGDPALYFYGVAQKVHHEYLRRRAPAVETIPTTLAASAPDAEIEQEHECLERCMQQLSPQHRELVLQYYREDKQAKIRSREELARQLGIALNALRIRAHRIRAKLQQCVSECLKQETAV